MESDVVFGQANAAIAAKQYGEAIRILTPRLGQDNSGQTERLIGMAHLGAGNAAAALPLLQTAHERAPGDVTTLFALGNAHARCGDLEQAKETYELGVQTDARHPGCKVQLLDVCRQLALRDEASNPMQAIGWLYRAWQYEPLNTQLAAKILDIYVNNGWNEAAGQFADQLDPRVAGEQVVKAKISRARQAVAAQAQISAAQISAAQAQAAQARAAGPASGAAANAPAGVPGSVQATTIACRFCQNQILSTVQVCPFCKQRLLTVRDASTAEWQPIALNIICVLMILFNLVAAGISFSKGAHKSAETASSFMLNFVSLAMNVMIMLRVDFVMTISRYLYMMHAVAMGCCLVQTLTLDPAQQGVSTGPAPIVLALLAIFQIVIDGLMIYLLAYEGSLD